MERIKRKTEIPKSMVELAKLHGYEPGDFLIRRFVEHKQLVEKWLDDLEHGVIPEEFVGTHNKDSAYKVVNNAVASLREQELELLPYFHGKKKFVEVEATNMGLADLLRAMNEKNAGGSGESE